MTNDHHLTENTMMLLKRIGLNSQAWWPALARQRQEDVGLKQPAWSTGVPRGPWLEKQGGGGAQIKDSAIILYI